MVKAVSVRSSDVGKQKQEMTAVTFIYVAEIDKKLKRSRLPENIFLDACSCRSGSWEFSFEIRSINHFLFAKLNDAILLTQNKAPNNLSHSCSHKFVSNSCNDLLNDKLISIFHSHSQSFRKCTSSRQQIKEVNERQIAPNKPAVGRLEVNNRRKVVSHKNERVSVHVN
jgi:hypothetical protein